MGAVIYSGALNDLYALDLSKMRWTNLTAPGSESGDGDRPSPRGYPGFAAVSGKVYVFGGIDDSGGECTMRSSAAVFKSFASPHSRTWLCMKSLSHSTREARNTGLLS